MPEFDPTPDPDPEGDDSPPDVVGGTLSPPGVSSPPPLSASPGRRNADDVRRRLATLARLLRHRFDRRAWDEYLRLRRAEKHNV